MSINILNRSKERLVNLFTLSIGSTFMFNDNLFILSRAKQDEPTVQALNLHRNGSVFAIKPSEKVLPVSISIEILEK